MTVLRKAFLLSYLYLAKRTEEASHQLTLFALVMMINFPLFGVLWKLQGFQRTEEFFLRLMATGLCVLLISHSLWPRSLLKFLPFLWYFTLLFCLSFFFTYFTLLNHGATLWLMNCVSAIFFLFLLTNVLDALWLLFLGGGFALLYFYSGSSNSLAYIPGEVSVFSLIITYVAAILIGALFARDREKSHAGRISGMRLLAGSIAHDLRTPLASIYLQAGLQEMLVEKLNNPEVQRDLKQNLSKITKGIEMSNQLISMQLNNIQSDRFDTRNFSIYSAKDLLNKALDDYPFRASQKLLLHLEIGDNFPVWIGEVAFKNLIWNLLKNSLEVIAEKDKGEIFIWLSRGEEKEDFNYLHIKDTAKGIYPEQAEKIFDCFYTDRKGGTGVGLSYCKLLMEAAGGGIYCKGKQDEYAHFTLKFPKID